MSGIEEVAAGAAIIGVGTSIYGQISGAKAQEEAAKKDASFKEMQANEILSRQAVNEQIMLEQSALSEKSYGAAFASSGREGGGIGGMLRIHSQTIQNIESSRRDANFKAFMLKSGAQVETDLASDRMTASYITGAGTLLTGATQAYSLYRGPSKATSLDGVKT